MENYRDTIMSLTYEDMKDFHNRFWEAGTKV
jgi:predicted Zn-dependent peptidase